VDGRRGGRQKQHHPMQDTHTHTPHTLEGKCECGATSGRRPGGPRLLSTSLTLRGRPRRKKEKKTFGA
jgi:hypothetical protein